jgi:signal transduction histidine kinase
LELLCRTLNLAAASLYIYTPQTTQLRLRAQVGFDYGLYESFELTINSFPGRAITEQRTIIDRHPGGSALFRDKQILGSVTAGGIVAAPLRLRTTRTQDLPLSLYVPDPLGAVCLYPRDPEDLEPLAEWIKQHGQFLARLYVGTLDRQAMAFRRQTVDRVAFRGDIGSLAHSFLTLVKDELSVEAASLWTVDARRNLLYLRRSTDLAVADRERDVSAIHLTDPGVIATCFETQTPMFHTRREPVLIPSNIQESLQRPLDNAAIIPVELPAEAKLRGRGFPSAGVLALMNHFTKMGDAEHLTAFSWEDSFFAGFACEVISVLIYQMLRTQDHESDFERLIHGARTSLQAARSNLQFLEARDVDAVLPPESRHLVPNAIDWLEDLESQINRDELVGIPKLELTDIRLYGDVLAKLDSMVRRMRTRSRNPTFSLSGFDLLSQNYHLLPPIRGNKRALDCVFRNLIDNSMKYCHINSDVSAFVHIEVSLINADKGVKVTLRDNGIGIPSEERDLIFENGFRGKRASGRHTQGVGRGLHECRVLLERMGGHITVDDCSDGAQFSVLLNTDNVVSPS